MLRKNKSFLEKYAILSAELFGFQKGKSCADAVASLTEYLHKALNHNKYVVTLFVDLRKSHDTIIHDILLQKLEAYGLRAVAGNWLRSYLNNRRQRVKIGNNFSSSRAVSNRGSSGYGLR